MTNESSKKFGISTLLKLLGGLFLLWVFYGFASFALVPLLVDHDLTKAGQLGDMFGAINALFSAFAFAGLIYTILLQREELSLQREELESTRIEIRGQKEQLEAQNLTIKRQVFESSFFALLGAYQDNIKLLDIRNREGVVIRQGRDCFSYFFNSTLKNAYAHFKKGDGSVRSEALRSRIERVINQTDYSELVTSRGGPAQDAVKAYVYLFMEHQADVGHYFRTVYHLIRFIDESDLPDSEKRRFCRILRAQLSTYELLLFFYNGVSPYGYKKFWPLANKYEFFQNLDIDLLLDPSHKSYYSGALG
ncbi:MAG: putative phage abortive infection protein [Azonexus sp.]|jgi:hypothetical protein|nr:putative phage abortive infection protein [Azonexus sp.]